MPESILLFWQAVGAGVTIFAKGSILDVWQGAGCVSGYAK